MRAGSPVAKHYDERVYIVIQSDFDQRKVGDYTRFVYAKDITGNISFANTATLRIVDNTAPEVGTVNLYDAKVVCSKNVNCQDEDNWKVESDIYLPVSSFVGKNLTGSGITTSDIYVYEGGSYKIQNNKLFGNTAADVNGVYYKVPANSHSRKNLARKNEPVETHDKRWKVIWKDKFI